MVSSSADIEPAYMAAMNKYQEIAPKRNVYLVEIQNAQTQEELEKLIPVVNL